MQLLTLPFLTLKGSFTDFLTPPKFPIIFLIRFFAGLVFLALCLFPRQSMAAAWTQGKGERQLINNIYLYVTNEYYDVDGYKRGQQSFVKVEYNPYFEMGATDTLTLGMSPRLQHLAQDGISGRESSFGLAEAEFFVRKKLWQNDRIVFSLQPLIKIPGLYSSSERPNLGPKQMDVELRALLGYGSSFGRISYFENIEIAYRKRFGNPSDEIRVDGTLGIRPAANWLVLAQIFSTFSTHYLANNNFLNTNPTDFALMRVQLSVVRQLNERFSLQLGGFSHVEGRNTGAGGGLLVSMWVNF